MKITIQTKKEQAFEPLIQSYFIILKAISKHGLLGRSRSVKFTPKCAS